MPTKPNKVTVKGFSRLNTESVASHLDDTELRVLENMMWTGNNTIEKRKGIGLYKNNAQWTSSRKVTTAIDFDLSASGAKEMYALDNGDLYYTTINNTSPTATYTRVNSIAGTTPAFAAARIYMKVLNNKLFAVDGSANLYYMASDMALKLNRDPDGFYFEMTVDAAAAVTVNDTYEESATDRRYVITETKLTTVGTTIRLRQTAGTLRPGASGTLTRLTGSGDASRAFTAVAYPEKFIALSIHEGRLMVLSDFGTVYLSATNDGNDVDGVDSTFMDYAKDDSLLVTNVVSFKRSSIITASNSELRRSSISTLTGYRRYDSADLEFLVDGVFKVQKESNFLGVLGRSGAEVGNSFIGLTKNGFITFSTLQANNEFGIVDNSYISKDIQRLINRINWDYADKIVAAVDFDSQRYLCAVPLDFNTECSMVFIYDFKHSSPTTAFKESIHKWTVAAYTLDTGVNISSLFTIRGKIFIADTAGNIHETDKDQYTDNSNTYQAQFITKAFDLDVVDTKKKFERLCGHLLVRDTESFNIYMRPIVDEQLVFDDMNDTTYDDILADPRTIRIEPWSLDPDDVWTNSPFDVWESPYATELIVTLADMEYEGRQVALLVRDRGSDVYWGCSGVSVQATDYADFADDR